MMTNPLFPIHAKCGNETIEVWISREETYEFDHIGKQSFIRESGHLYCEDCREEVRAADCVQPERPIEHTAASQAIYDTIRAENPWLFEY